MLGGEAGGEGEGAFGAIEDIEVVAGGTLGEQVADLRECPVDPNGFNNVGVFGCDFEPGDEFFWQGRAAHGGEALDLF